MLRRTLTVCCAEVSPVRRIGRFAAYADVNGVNGVWRVEMSSDKAFGGSTRNLMDDDFFNEIHETFDWISNIGDRDIRAVVLHASLKGHFSAGLDLKSAAPKLLKDLPTTQSAKLGISAALGLKTPTVSEPGMPAMRAMEIRRLITRYQNAFSSLVDCRVPVIAAMWGHCIGGAVDLASACDIRYASSDAVLSIKEAAVGIVADLGTLQRASRIVGEGTVREWAFTARDVKADEAERKHFYNTVLESREACLEHALRVAGEISKSASPIAVQGTKAILNFTSEKPTREGLEHVKLWNCAFLKSEDLLEASLAFMQKREPSFSGTEKVIDDQSRDRVRGSYVNVNQQS